MGSLQFTRESRITNHESQEVAAWAARTLFVSFP